MDKIPGLHRDDDDLTSFLRSRNQPRTTMEATISAIIASSLILPHTSQQEEDDQPRSLAKSNLALHNDSPVVVDPTSRSFSVQRRKKKSRFPRSQSHRTWMPDTRETKHPIEQTDISNIGGWILHDEHPPEFAPPQLHIDEDDGPPAGDEASLGSTLFRQSPSLTDRPNPHTYDRLFSVAPYLPESELEAFY